MEDGLADGGIAAFTLENAPDDYEEILNKAGEWRWQLQPSGRFAHNKQYVLEVSKNHNLKVLRYEEMRGFRNEGGKDVNGHIFIVQKVEVGQEL
mmetsp:Transcript_22771/g.33349  ORF Transcript_22771/g.33349 Transcript_22771/m.33349 type:complete len:94 (+) Transcript_22771:245-526(+)